jgi:DNA-binding beta-propeller fold protein YncE
VKTNPFPTSEVWAFNIETKKRTHRIALPPVSFCNDLVTDDDGTVYATDSANPDIYKVSPQHQTFSVFLSSPQFAPVGPGAVGLNGLDFSPDGERLLVVTTFPAAIYSVPLADPQASCRADQRRRLRPPGDPRFPGPDGIEFHDEELLRRLRRRRAEAVLQRRRLHAGQRSDHHRGADRLDQHHVAEGEVYVIDSEVFRALYLFLPPDPALHDFASSGPVRRLPVRPAIAGPTPALRAAPSARS